MLRRSNFLNSLTMIILVSTVWSSYALADVVPENLASMARSLLLGVETELRQTNKDETQDAIRKRARSILRQAGIRHWTRKPASQDETIAEPTQTHQMLVGDNDERVELKWDRPNKKFTIRIKANETRTDASDGFDLQLNGKVTLKPGDGDGKAILDVQPDEHPTSILTGEELKAINASVSGNWRDQEGNIWEISKAGDDSDDTVPTHQLEQQIEDVSRQIASTKRDMVHIWENKVTKEIVKQDRFKRLDNSFEYIGKDFPDPATKERFAGLENQLEKLRTKLKPLPVNTYDPISMKKMLADKRKRKLNIQVTDKNNYSWTYDAAAQIGDRIKARRTLREQDLAGLPDKVIGQLIATWSPPEWIELVVGIEHKTRQVTLNGDRWRMHWTASSDYHVKTIHTPYPEELRMERFETLGKIAVHYTYEPIVTADPDFKNVRTTVQPVENSELQIIDLVDPGKFNRKGKFDSEGLVQIDGVPTGLYVVSVTNRVSDVPNLAPNKLVRHVDLIIGHDADKGTIVKLTAEALPPIREADLTTVNETPERHRKLDDPLVTGMCGQAWDHAPSVAVIPERIRSMADRLSGVMLSDIPNADSELLSNVRSRYNRWKNNAEVYLNKASLLCGNE